MYKSLIKIYTQADKGFQNDLSVPSLILDINLGQPNSPNVQRTVA